MDNSYTLVYILSGYCNFRCRYCYESLDIKSKTAITEFDIFHLEDMIIIFDAFCEKYDAPPRQITFFGGEPLLHKNLIADFIKMVKNKCICAPEFYMITNASLLNGAFQQFAIENLSAITFSIDGTKKIHDKYRLTSDGKPTFDTVIKNVRQFQEKNKKNGTKVFTGIEVTLTDAYVGATQFDTEILCEESWELFKNLQVSIVDYIPVKGNIHSLFSSQVDEEKSLYVIDKLVSLWFEDFINLRLETDVISFQSVLFSLIKKNRHRLMCNAGKSYFAVTPNMRVYDCQVSLFNGKPPIMCINEGKLISFSMAEPVLGLNKICSECVCRNGCTHYCKAEWDSLMNVFPDSCQFRICVRNILEKKIREIYNTNGKEKFIKAVVNYYGATK